MRIASPPWIIAPLFVLALSACDEGVRSPDFIPRLDSIQVCPQPQNGVCPSSGCTTANARVPAGRSQQFCAVGFFEGLNTDDVLIPRSSRNITEEVLWTSSITAFATIDSASGNASAVSTGVTTIVAETDGVSGSSLLEVTDAELERVSINPPLVSQTVPRAVTVFSCTGEYSDGACPGANQTLCSVTEDSNWSSLRPTIARVGNAVEQGSLDSKGVMLAVAPGNTEITCNAPVGPNMPPASATARPVRVCESVLLDAPLGLRLRVGGSVIDPDEALLLTQGGNIQFELRGAFRNLDPNCGPIDSIIDLDLTDSASWASDRPNVVSVGNRFGRDKGRADYVSPGLAEITATFDGSSVTASIFAIDARVEELTINGPDFLFAPGQYPFTAEALFVTDEEIPAGLPEGCVAAAEDAEGRFLCDVTNSVDILWGVSRLTASSNGVQADIRNNDGLLDVFAESESGTLEIAATFRGQSAAKQAVVVPANLIDVRVNPGLACISSSTLGTNLAGSPTQRQLDAELVYDLVLPGAETATRCTVTNSEAASWNLVATQSQSGSDLVDIVPNVLASLAGLGGFGDVPAGAKQGCLPLLPVGVIGDDDGPGPDTLAGAPAFVSNDAGSRGLVTANEQAVLTLIPGLTVGTACVTATVNLAPEDTDGDGILDPVTAEGSGTVLVATDIVPEVCSALEGQTNSLLTDGIPPDLLGVLLGADPEFPACFDLLTAPPPEEEEGGDGAEAGGLPDLGGLLGGLVGGAR